MNGDAGKGSKMRSGANNSAYWQNYDNIFRRPKENPVSESIWRCAVCRHETKNPRLDMNYAACHRCEDICCDGPVISLRKKQ